MNRRGLMVAVLAVAAAGALDATAAPILIADVTSAQNAVVGPAVNDAGVVAFTVSVFDSPQGTEGNFIGSGGPVTRVATLGSGGGQFNPLSSPAIGDSGAVTFFGKQSGVDLIRATGGGPATIASSSGVPYASFLNPPSRMNVNGLVAFAAALDAGGEGVYVSDGTNPHVTIADTTTAGGMFGGGVGLLFPTFNRPAISDNGSVAFVASLTAGGAGIFIGNGSGPPVTIADTSGPMAAFGGVSINAAGKVAFQASTDAGTQAIYTWLGGQLTLMADTTGALSALFNPSISDQGQVAFLADLHDGSRAIYLAKSPQSLVEIISTDAQLMGLPVDNLGFGTDGLNSTKQLAFAARLGPWGFPQKTPQAIFRVAVPEPTAVSLLLPGALALLRRRGRRARTSCTRRRRTSGTASNA
jgi:hypothetical protein